MTLKEAQKKVAANGSTLRRDGSGEYVLRKGKSTYFTDDLQDAVDTAAHPSWNMVQYPGGRMVK